MCANVLFEQISAPRNS